MELGTYTSAEMTPDPIRGGPSALPQAVQFRGRVPDRDRLRRPRDAARVHPAPETGLEHLETLVAEILASARELAQVAAA